MARIEGVITAMLTPFDESGEIDWPAVRRVARHLVDTGSNGIVVAGTTGEAPTLRDAEHVALLAAVRDEVGDGVTLICGTGTNDTRHTLELTRDALGAGADACLVTAPYYNKPNRAGLRAHYEAVADIGLPVIVYNIPSRSVVNIDPELLAELARHENVVAVKQANDDEVQEIDGLDLLAGNDEAFLPALEVGASGGILVASHVVGPQMSDIREAVQGGDLDRARELDTALHPVYEAMNVTTNPIPVKAAAAMLGLCGPTMRLPMLPPDEGQRETIRRVLEARGALSGSAA